MFSSIPLRTSVSLRGCRSAFRTALLEEAANVLSLGLSLACSFTMAAPATDFAPPSLPSPPFITTPVSALRLMSRLGLTGGFFFAPTSDPVREQLLLGGMTTE